MELKAATAAAVEGEKEEKKLLERKESGSQKERKKAGKEQERRQAWHSSLL
jgi:hypothetical protein